MNALFLASRKPPNNRTIASIPKITAKVTTAPITPATTVEIPELSGGEVGDGVPTDPPPVDVVVEDELAQTPVVFPHALHQELWSPIAIFAISAVKVFHGMVVSDCPKSG